MGTQVEQITGGTTVVLRDNPTMRKSKSSANLRLVILFMLVAPFGAAFQPTTVWNTPRQMAESRAPRMSTTKGTPTIALQMAAYENRFHLNLLLHDRLS